MTNSFRLARLQDLQSRQDRYTERLRKLREEVAALEAAQFDLHRQFVRAQNFDPGQGACPQCAIDDAVVSRLIVLPLAGASSIARRCSRCGWTEAGEQAA